MRRQATGNRHLAVAALAIARRGAAGLLIAPNRLTPENWRRCRRAMPRAASASSGLAGCASCHAAPQASGDAMLQLAGGVELESAFGTFVAPNISHRSETTASAAGRASDFANAVLRGVSPDGRHYYPAFPYTSYSRMSDRGRRRSLRLHADPAGSGRRRAGAPRLAFPFTVRRGIGLWKRLYLNDEPQVALAGASEEVRARAVSGRGARPLRRMPHAARDDRRAGDGPLAGRPCPTSRPAATSPTGARTDIADYLETASRRISIRPAGGWRRSCATWRGCRPRTATAIAAYLKACRRGAQSHRRALSRREEAARG